MALTSAGPSQLAALAANGTMEHLPSLTPDNSEEVYAESVSDGHLALSRSPSAFLQGSVGHAGSHRLRSGAASMTTSASDSGSVHSTSTHSRERVLGSIFGRRGSVLTNGLRPKSTGSNRSSSMIHDDQSLDAYEMTTMSRIKKKRIVEDIEKRVDRAKADAALVKWRKWIAEQPPQETEANPLYPGAVHSVNGHSSYTHHSFENYSVRSLDTPAPLSPPFLTESRSASSLGGPSSYASHSYAAHHHLPVSPTRMTARGSIGYDMSVDSRHRRSTDRNPSPPRATTHSPSIATGLIIPGAQDIYTTESVRVLRDVELAIDPAYLGVEHVSPTSRVRRLSTHPRVSEAENPFAAIDTLLCRRLIRPLVLELVQALGAFIDAVWATTHTGQPIPWAGMPTIAVARRASSLNPMPQHGKGWHSWTIAAVQEGKRRGLLPDPPTAADVDFWELEIRYGLRDIDEAVNRRKDLGWAFGEVVIRGNYGDIIPSNVFAAGDNAGNIPRLLNDLEEALWGDAIPAPSDVAFEHDPDFDPFSVYREGDELIGVEVHKKPEVRESELRSVFGDSISLQSAYGRRVSLPTTPRKASAASASSPSGKTSPLYRSPEQPTLTLSPPSSPWSRSDASPRTPTDGIVLTVPELDFSALGALQDLSLEEKLELGRRRHQEYLERTRLEFGDACATGIAV